MQRSIRRVARRTTFIVAALALPLACGPSVPVSPSIDAPSPSISVPSTDLPTPPASEPPVAVARWSELEPAGTTPSARSGHTWTVDPSSAVAYLFGGAGVAADGTAAPVVDDLWAYDMTADSWQALQPPDATPGSRRDHAAAWIDGLGLVVAGGRGVDGVLDDLWAYDPNANGWRTLDVVGPSPPARADACVAMRVDGRLWLHGGSGDDGAPFGDTWVYDPGPSSWTLVAASGDGPPPRAGAACFWTSDDRFVVDGGSGVEGAVLGDAWVLDPASASWTPVAIPAGIPARAAAAYASTGSGGVVVGGSGSDEVARSDLVVFDATTLTPTRFEASPDGPTPRLDATLVDDPQGERLLLFGGAGPTGPVGDLWSLDLP